MKELTDKEIEYINDKLPHWRDFGFVIGKKIAEIYLEDIGGNLEDLKSSPYLIDKPLKANTN